MYRIFWAKGNNYAKLPRPLRTWLSAKIFQYK